MGVLVPLLGSPEAVLPRGNKQMANGPRKAAFTLGFLCCRIACYSALSVSSTHSWECKTQVGSSSPIFTEQVPGSEEHLASWELARTLANCYCVLPLREEVGEGRAPPKPRGSPPGAHVVNSMCWEMPACVAPQLGTQTQPRFDQIDKADREQWGRFPWTKSNGRGSGQGRLLCSCFAVDMGAMPGSTQTLGTFSLFHGGPSLSIESPR